MAYLDVMNKALILLLGFLCFAAFALQNDAKQPIQIEADSVIIDELKGLSVYTGEVNIMQGSLQLSAETIKLFSKEQKITKIIAKGTNNKPAHYQQNQSNQPRFTQATAINITYLPQKEWIHLQGQAHLIQGFDSFKGATLEYDIKNDKVVVKQSKDGTQRVKFKIKL